MLVFSERRFVLLLLIAAAISALFYNQQQQQSGQLQQSANGHQQQRASIYGGSGGDGDDGDQSIGQNAPSFRQNQSFDAPLVMALKRPFFMPSPSVSCVLSRFGLQPSKIVCSQNFCHLKQTFERNDVRRQKFAHFCAVS